MEEVLASLQTHMLEKMAEAAVLKKAVKAARTSDLHNNAAYDAYKAAEVKAADAAKDLGQAAVESFKKATTGCRYLLSSAPEFDLDDRPVLAVLKGVIEALDGQNLAGDAKDTFHQQVMPASELTQEKKGWRVAWLGKVTTGITPNNRIFVVTYKGGPETDWEQEQIEKTRFPSLMKGNTLSDDNLQVLHFVDLDAFLDYVTKKAIEGSRKAK